MFSIPDHVEECAQRYRYMPAPGLIVKFAPIASNGNPLRMALKGDEALRAVAGQRPFAMAKQPLQRLVAAAGE